MILLEKLTIKDFLSHHETEIFFKEDVKLLVDGKSGSGKSTVVEAILWCLFGRGRSDNRSLIRRGAKSATVSLKLNSGEQSFIITRSVSGSGKNTLTVTRRKGEGKNYLPIETTGLKDTQEWIENTLLRSSFELFTNSIAYTQDGDESFVKANASRRKDLLLEIVRASNFDELYIKARDAITGIESDVAVVNSQMEGLEKTIRDNEDLAGKLVQYEKEVEEVTKEINLKTKEQRKLEDKKQEIFYLGHELEDKEALFTHLKEGVVQLGNEILEDVKKVEEFENTDINTATEKNKELEQLVLEESSIQEKLRKNVEFQNLINAHLANKPKVSDYTEEIKRINTQLIPLIKDSGKCPAGDDCPFTVPIKGQIEFLTNQIQEKEKTMLIDTEAFESWTKRYNQLTQPTDTTELYKRMEEIKVEKDKLIPYRDMVIRYDVMKSTNDALKDKIEKDRAQIIKDALAEEKLSQEVEIMKEKLSKLNEKNNEIALFNGEEILKILNRNREEAIRNQTLAKKAQDTVQDGHLGLKTLVKDTEKLKVQYDDLLLLKEALSPRGVKAVAVDYVLPVLEERMNEILSQMSDFRIRLDTQQEKLSDEGNREGLFITIRNDVGEELSFENLSGGEGVKVSMAISEALASLGSNVGFRVLDEAVTSLDNESTEAFVEVLLKLQEKFPQVICISHIPEVKSAFEKTIKIIKVNGISKIQ